MAGRVSSGMRRAPIIKYLVLGCMLLGYNMHKLDVRAGCDS
jgi:hypothetical protein